jgi:hypothetical protein
MTFFSLAHEHAQALPYLLRHRLEYKAVSLSRQRKNKDHTANDMGLRENDAFIDA